MLNVASSRLFANFFSPTPAGIWHGALAALRGKLSQADPRHYNIVQRFAYLFAMLDIMLLVLSGLVIWKSVQSSLPRDALGGDEITKAIFVTNPTLVATGKTRATTGSAVVESTPGSTQLKTRPCSLWTVPLYLDSQGL